MRVKIVDCDLISRTNHRFPNLACMKISGYHKKRRDRVELVTDFNSIGKYDLLWVAKVFTSSWIPDGLLNMPNTIDGGSGFYFDQSPNLPPEIEHHFPDYHLYDKWIEQQIQNGKKAKEFEYYTEYSIGRLTRGCFRRCSFCINRTAKKVEFASHVSEFLDCNRPYICLIDDQFLGYKDWGPLLDELIQTGKPFQFKQGNDVRCLRKEQAEKLATANYHREMIFAYDRIEDTAIITRKLHLWRKYSDMPTKLYVLCAYDPSGTYSREFWVKDIVDTFRRIFILATLNCLPYIMRYEEYHNSPFRGIYNNIGAWVNQPEMLKTKTFRQFSIQRGISSTVYNTYKDDPEQYIKDGYKKGISWLCLDDLTKQFPSIADMFFDVKYGEHFNEQIINIPITNRKVNKEKYKINTTMLRCRVDSKKLCLLKEIYGNLTNTQLIDRLINEKVKEAFSTKATERLDWKE